MKTPVIILPVILGNSTLPQVPYEDIENLPEFETDASDHWIFDKGNASNLIGGLAGTTLQPVGAAPVHSPASMLLADGGRTGMISAFPDAAVSTLCGVFRRRAIVSPNIGVPLMGSVAFDAESGGSGMYDFIGGVIQGRTRLGAAVGVSGTASMAVDTWYFAAIVNAAGTNTYYVGGIGASVETQAKTLADRNYALGNAYIANEGYYDGARVAEFMIFGDTAKSQAELASIYARSKVRMARRNITLR